MKRIAVITGSTSASDRAAVGLATRRLMGQVRAYTFTGDAEALRYAAAAGAVEVRAVENAAGIDFDVALVGGGAWPDDSLAARLAVSAEAALVLDVLDVQWKDDELSVLRDLGRGARQLLRVKGRAVLGVSDEAVNLLYVSRRRRASATAASVGSPAIITDTWEPARLRTRTAGIAARTGGSATDRASALFGVGETAGGADERNVIQADVATCAKYLLRYLAHNDFIDAVHGGEPLIPAVPGAAAIAPVAQSTRVEMSRRIARGPRPTTGATAAMARRPRAVSTVPLPAKLFRRPRPVGQARPSRIRGPYPHRS